MDNKKKKLIKLLIIIINLNILINKNIYNLCPMGSLYFVGFVGFKYILNFDTKKKKILNLNSKMDPICISLLNNTLNLNFLN